MSGRLNKVTAVKKPAIIGLIHLPIYLMKEHVGNSQIRVSSEGPLKIKSYPPLLVAVEAGHKGVNSSLQRSDAVPVGLWEGAILGLLSDGSSAGPDGL